MTALRRQTTNISKQKGGKPSPITRFRTVWQLHEAVTPFYLLRNRIVNKTIADIAIQRKTLKLQKTQSRSYVQTLGPEADTFHILGVSGNGNSISSQPWTSKLNKHHGLWSFCFGLKAILLAALYVQGPLKGQTL